MPVSATPAVEKLAIGRYVYLFKSSLNNEDCVISSHGVYAALTETFQIPQGVTINFFVPLNFVLRGAAMKDVLTNLHTALKVDSATHPYVQTNYLLTKFQGAHGDVNETYASIVRDITQQVDIRSKETWAGLCQGGKAASVVTIRNRFDVFTGVPLSDVIAAVRTRAPDIKNFYCSFCRIASTQNPAKAPAARFQHY